MFEVNEGPGLGVNGQGTITAVCPNGKRAISVSGEFSNSYDGVQTRLLSASGMVLGRNSNGLAGNKLKITLLCATVS